MSQDTIDEEEKEVDLISILIIVSEIGTIILKENMTVEIVLAQIKIITISENHVEYGKKVADTLKKSNIRVDSDYSDNTIGKKIRLHRKMRPAYMVIIGEDEQKNNTVSIRKRNGEQKNGILLNEFVELLSKECGNKEHKNIF